MLLEDYGWNDSLAERFQPYTNQGLVPARVTAVWSWQYELATNSGRALAEITGKLRFNALYAAKRPVIGDWVAVKQEDDHMYTINAVLTRRGCLQRQQVDGGLEAQAIAANVDACLIVQSLLDDFNLARLDRYIALAANANVTPVVVLTKSDLVANAQEQAQLVRNNHPELKVFAVSAITAGGIDPVRHYLQPGKTYVALGSSGVGKSTLLNSLCDTQQMKTAPVREDDQRGRHTTTHRQMFLLPGGALYIDTPGIRELALFEPGGLSGSFPDIEALAESCKFKDCSHNDEPGCKVQAAVKSGELAWERLDNFRKLEREEACFEQKQITLSKKIAKTRIKRKGVHYKDYMRGGSKAAWQKDY